MVRRPALSRAEMEVARALWDLGEATVRQVFEALPAKRNLHFSTVQTYLRRLEAKGYAEARIDARARIYTARVKPETVIRETVGELVQRLFDGQSLPLVQHLIEEGGMSRADVARLREQLDRLEEDDHGAN